MDLSIYPQGRSSARRRRRRPAQLPSSAHLRMFPALACALPEPPASSRLGPHSEAPVDGLPARGPLDVAPISVHEWSTAQKLLGLPATASTHPDQLLGWNTRRRGHFTERRGCTDVTYVMQDKCGSESIHANLLAQQNETGQACTSQHACSMTFVREPLSRFVSAYSEVEWRFHDALRMNVSRDGLDWFRFHKHPLGTRARALAFIEDVLSLQWQSNGEASKTDGDVNHFSADKDSGFPPALFWRAGLLHVFPMLPQVWAHAPVDFVGKVEQMDADWRRMVMACGLSATLAFDPGRGQHVTSDDRLGVKPQMEELIRGNCTVRAALCLIYRVDLEAFGYGCAGCDSHPKSQKSPRAEASVGSHAEPSWHG